jgi:hypothetical protein
MEIELGALGDLYEICDALTALVELLAEEPRQD